VRRRVTPARFIGALVSTSVAIGAVMSFGRAEAADQGTRCARTELGSASLSSSGVTVVCSAGPLGYRWGPGVYTAPSTIAPAPTATRAATPTNGPVANGRCNRPDEQALSVVDASLLRCTSGRWSLIPTGPQLPLPPIQGPALPPSLPQSTTPYIDPLDPGLGYPNGLPYDLKLPPNATLLLFQPTVLPSGDFWKKARWRNEAYLTGVDMEAVNTWFVNECTRIGWIHDPRKVERLPVPIPANKYYETPVKMLLGECRTIAGSATDPTRRRPWFLAWGVTLRPNTNQLELVTELRSFPRAGGRSG
jgi:hypothetical protein